jgi:hypothetical protein
MTWTILSAIGELVSALGVIISLIYLARQIRDSSQSTRASMRDSVLRQQHEWTCLISASENAPYVCAKGSNDFFSLTEVERAQYLFIMFGMTKMFENMYLHYCDGLIEHEVWIRNRAMLASYVSQPGGKFYVESRLAAYDPRFQQVLREIGGIEKVSPAHDLIKKDFAVTEQ